MQVFHLSVECFPVAKVGGLADVVGALPKYQRKLGIDARVVMPWYNKPYMQHHAFEEIAQGSFYQGSQLLHYTVHKQVVDSLGFPLYVIHIADLLDRPEVYCYDDEAEQWLAFQHAFLDWLVKSNLRPDLINCHDHHVGLIPFLIKNSQEFQELSNVKTLATVHNGHYQGWMHWNKGILLPSFDTWKWGLLDWSGLINPLAAAIKSADAYSTVSEGYLNELTFDSNGLEDLFKSESAKGYGIVNGIDLDIWDPEQDSLLAEKYAPADVLIGKRKNKEAFCEKYNLSPSRLLLTYIGRFAQEKGADYLAKVIQDLSAKKDIELSVFILGSGDAEIQKDIEAASQNNPNVAVYFGYNESLAHEVYAAADMILMPSRVEPCGLNQLYALKYGTIPIVRGIGGLKDTVLDISDSEGYGFVFDKLEVPVIVETICRAVAYLSQPNKKEEIVKRAMSLDYSWTKSAQKYIELYNQLLK